MEGILDEEVDIPEEILKEWREEKGLLAEAYRREEAEYEAWDHPFPGSIHDDGSRAPFARIRSIRHDLNRKIFDIRRLSPQVRNLEAVDKYFKNLEFLRDLQTPTQRQQDRLSWLADFEWVVKDIGRLMRILHRELRKAKLIPPKIHRHKRNRESDKPKDLMNVQLPSVDDSMSVDHNDSGSNKYEEELPGEDSEGDERDEYDDGLGGATELDNECPTYFGDY